MAYNEFTLHKAQQAFSLKVSAEVDLFAAVKEAEIGEFLRMTLDRLAPLGEAISTEKARSEFIIAPILAEVRSLMQKRVSLFSGIEFNVAPEKGLKGVCHFIFSPSPLMYELTAPVLMIVEAKREDIVSGMGQCVAEMLAAKIFNEREGNQISTLYGAVTSGGDWKFLKLDGDTVFIDRPRYYLAQVGKILGILPHILQDGRASQALAA